MLWKPKFWTLWLWSFISLLLIGIITYQLYSNIREIKRSRMTVIIHWDPPEKKITCHNSNREDALPSASDPKFSPSLKSIFFHETSCRGGIDSRQACSVESAARIHPFWEVYLLFNSPVTEKMMTHSCLSNLLKFPNVRIGRIHAEEYAHNSAVNAVVTDQLKKSLYPIEHTADIMRMLTLNKFGGVYLDLDQLVVKAFDSLPSNFIVRETSKELATGIMAFSKYGIGHKITKLVLEEIAKIYNPQSLDANGAQVIQKVLKKVCKERKLHGYCKRIPVFSQAMFYPLQYSQAHLYFINGIENSDYLESGKFFTHHMWNLLTRSYSVEQNSTYAKLAKKYCPAIYKLYGKDFGV